MWLLLLACQTRLEPVAPRPRPLVASRLVEQEMILADVDPRGENSVLRYSVAAGGDVNADGYDDVWLVIHERGGVELRLGSATGLSTTAAAFTPIEGASQALSTDHDGDGRPDLLVRTASGPDDDDGVWIYAVAPDGSLTLRRSYRASRIDQLFPPIDDDGDGSASVVFGRNVGHNLQCGQGGGWSTWAETHLTILDLGGGERRFPGVNDKFPSISVGDLNGDGWSDLQVHACASVPCGGQPPAVLQVLFGAPQGLSPGRVWRDPTPCRVGQSWVVGDVNGDGVDDTVMGSNETFLRMGRTLEEVDLTAAKNALVAVSQRACGSDGAVEVISAGDLNGDGYHEVALYKNRMVHIHAGGPGGPEAGATEIDLGFCDGLHLVDEVYGKGLYPAGDVNGDGFPDLVGVWEHRSPDDEWTLRVYYGGPLDLDADGIMEPEDCGPRDPTVGLGFPEVADDGIDQDCDGSDGCYADLDHDGFWSTPVPLPAGAATCAAAGLGAEDIDCNDGRADVFPGAGEITVDDVDHDCDGFRPCYIDADQDGYGTSITALYAGSCVDIADAAVVDGDCYPTRSNAHPGAAETPDNLVDEDCDGRVMCVIDVDGDGYPGMGVDSQVMSPDMSCNHQDWAWDATDCTDFDTSIAPGRPEVAGDAVDQNCDGRLRCWVDGDGDQWGGTTKADFVASSCASPGAATQTGDCDDGWSAVYPGANDPDWQTRSWYVNGSRFPDMWMADEDCDGFITCPMDPDGDGFAAEVGPWVTLQGSRCPLPYASRVGDCAPNDPDIHYPGRVPYDEDDYFPTEAQFGDRIDNDCDGLLECHVDSDLDGFGAPGRAGVVGPAGPSCDVPSWSSQGTDCDDHDPLFGPAAEDLPTNDDDEDCDGNIACYVDADGDGTQGSAVELPPPPMGGSTWSRSCEGLGGYTFPGECDDTDGVGPAPEIPGNGIDENCDGVDDIWLYEMDREDEPNYLKSWGTKVGSPIVLLASRRKGGRQTCLPQLGGQCTMLRDPLVVESKRVGPDGHATFVLYQDPARGWDANRSLWVQAWVLTDGVWYGTNEESAYPQARP